MRIMGVDFGLARTGIAISDSLLIMAQPLTTISQKSHVLLTNKILELAKEHQVSEIVVGAPYSLEGRIAMQTNRTLFFVEYLKSRTDISVTTYDERLTSIMAHNALSAANVSGKKRQGLVDKLAAAFILQGYLDYLRNKRLAVED